MLSASRNIVNEGPVGGMVCCSSFPVYPAAALSRCCRSIRSSREWCFSLALSPRLPPNPEPGDAPAVFPYFSATDCSNLLQSHVACTHLVRLGKSEAEYARVTVAVGRSSPGWNIRTLNCCTTFKVSGGSRPCFIGAIPRQ